MMENPSRRCVVWFGQPSQRERNALAASGWGLRVASASDGGIGLRGGDTVVGLVDLRDPHAVPDNLPGLLEANVHLPLLALVPDGGEPIACPKLARVERIASSDADPARLVRRLDALARNTDHAGEPKPDNLLGQSPAMCAALGCIHKYAAVDLPVLITGETGTGKEVAARALHRLSRRAERPFIAVNCGALPASLIQAELFGHERGAFTGAQTQRRGRFEQAEGGTLFLDEIGDMPAELQTRLLRVLSDGHFYRVGGHSPIKANVRVIAATHQNLENRVKDGMFREDLFHRLNVIRIRLPALRERREDIPLLTRHFLQKSARELGVEAKRLSDAALKYLCGLDFQGNVRQLENLCHWLTVMAPGQQVEVGDLPGELREATPVALATDWESALEGEVDRMLARGVPDVHGVLSQVFERILIARALAHTGGRRIEAAQALGIGRNTITRKIAELGIEGGKEASGE